MAPGSGTGRAINLSGDPAIVREPLRAARVAGRAQAGTSLPEKKENQFPRCPPPHRHTDPDRWISHFYSPVTGRPAAANYRRRLWQTARVPRPPATDRRASTTTCTPPPPPVTASYSSPGPSILVGRPIFNLFFFVQITRRTGQSFIEYN